MSCMLTDTGVLKFEPFRTHRRIICDHACCVHGIGNLIVSSRNPIELVSNLSKWNGHQQRHTISSEHPRSSNAAIELVLPRRNSPL